MTTFITRYDVDGPGIRLAVKDLIDVAGTATTCGSAAFADAPPAERDASCVTAARRAGAVIVGKTNLHELALGATGVNPWSGTPTNPLDDGRVPGGSSSGSAVAVATGEADVAYGTDTAGSCRIPAACCGVVGLKTTHGRIPTDGVHPVAPSLDAVGPLARDVDGIIAGMRLLDPGFTPVASQPRRVGRVRVRADADVQAAIDEALARAGFEVEEVEVPDWDDAYGAGAAILLAESGEHLGHLLERREQLGEDIAAKLDAARYLEHERVVQARATIDRWRAAFLALVERSGLLALPTIPSAPPPLDAGAAAEVELSRLTFAANLAGVPAIALPVPTGGTFPASLQLVGPPGGEEVVVAAAFTVASS